MAEARIAINVLILVLVLSSPAAAANTPLLNVALSAKLSRTFSCTCQEFGRFHAASALLDVSLPSTTASTPELHFVSGAGMAGNGGAFTSRAQVRQPTRSNLQV
ncbi:MAG TPA: hypothetical protein VI136_03435 [Verrucomicrobiae bacterium]